jgi:hypothetical protein
MTEETLDQETTPEVTTEVTEAPQYNLDTEFEAAFGMPLTEAQQQYNQNLIINTLGDAWDVSPKQTKARIAEVTAYVQKLPPEQQAAYDSIEGVQKAYDEMTQASKAPVAPVSSGLFGFGNAAQKQTVAPKDYRSIDPRKDPVAYQAAIFDELVKEGLVRQ